MSHSVLILSEGSYPHRTGGVSVWMHNLTSSLKEFLFDCISLTYKDRTIKYRSENVRDINVIDVSTFPNNKFGDDNATYNIATKMLNGDVLSVEDLKNLRYFSVHTDGYLNALMDSYNGEADFGKYFWALSNTFAIITHIANTLRGDLNDDVIFAQNVGFCGLLGSALKCIFDIPLICTEHGIIMKEIDIYLGRMRLENEVAQAIKNIYASMMRTSYEHCDIVTPISYFHAEHSINNGCNPGKLRVIYTGIDLERFGSVASERPDPKEKVIIGNVGRIEPIKGTRRFVVLANEIRKSMNAEFWWVGPVDDERYASEVFELNERLGRPVEFKGVTDRPEKFYSRMHIMLMTSLSEGLPLAALEAQACGVPVLSSAVGDSEYVCFDNYTCDDDILKCAETVIEKIQNIIENWDEFSIFVRNWAQDFDIKRMADGYREVFEILCVGNL